MLKYLCETTKLRNQKIKNIFIKCRLLPQCNFYEGIFKLNQAPINIFINYIYQNLKTELIC